MASWILVACSCCERGYHLKRKDLKIGVKLVCDDCQGITYFYKIPDQPGVKSYQDRELMYEDQSTYGAKPLRKLVEDKKKLLKSGDSNA